MPGVDTPVERKDLSLQVLQLGAECLQAPRARSRARVRRPELATTSSSSFDAITADRRDDAKLGKVGADRVDHRGLLADEQMPRTVEHQTGSAGQPSSSGRTAWSASHRLANRLGIGGIVLLAFHIRLHVGWRHQSNRVTECLQLARPVVRRGARFDADHARRKLLEERQDWRASTAAE